jgi:hypothetical protein
MTTKISSSGILFITLSRPRPSGTYSSILSSMTNGIRRSMIDQIYKVRLNRLRRIAERRGYRLSKSLRRDLMALDYGKISVYVAAPEVTPLDHDPDNPLFTGLIDEVELFLHPDNLKKFRRDYEGT